MMEFYLVELCGAWKTLEAFREERSPKIYIERVRLVGTLNTLPHASEDMFFPEKKLATDLANRPAKVVTFAWLNLNELKRKDRFGVKARKGLSSDREGPAS